MSHVFDVLDQIPCVRSPPSTRIVPTEVLNMTAANKFTRTVPSDRVVQLPDDVPVGRVTLSVVSTPNDLDNPNDRLAARRTLRGPCLS